MKERPILFSAPMVRAIVAGTKTQTRRALPEDSWFDQTQGVIRMCSVAPGVTGFAEVSCRYGQPGDRLWVREAFRLCAEADSIPPRDTDSSYRVWYEADAPHQPGFGKLRPGMFMPRWASRLTLEVTDVRVERLQDISEADAVAEGIESRQVSETQSRWLRYDRDLAEGKLYSTTGDPRVSYCTLWEQINGPGSWDANPWVWALTFRRLEAA